MRERTTLKLLLPRLCCQIRRDNGGGAGTHVRRLEPGRRLRSLSARKLCAELFTRRFLSPLGACTALYGKRAADVAEVELQTGSSPLNAVQ